MILPFKIMVSDIKALCEDLGMQKHPLIEFNEKC